MANSIIQMPRGDTGWIDISSYVNSTYISIRNGYETYIKVKDGILYLRGQVYISTKVEGTPSFVTLFDQIPSKYFPNGQITGGAITYVTHRNYMLYLESKNRIRCTCSSYDVQSSPDGFDISVLSGKGIVY